MAYVRGSLLVDLDELDEVVALSERHRDAAKDEESRARWSACLALALFLRRNDEEDVTRAAGEASYAFARLPWEPYVVTARGMAHIEQGEYDDGLCLFDVGDARATGNIMRDAWRVVAHAACDRAAEADEALKRLRATSSPWPATIRSAEAAISA